MKFLYFVFLIMISVSLFGADCDKKIEKKEKKGGCKIEQTSENFINCLIKASTPEQTKLCHQKEKERKCNIINKKFKTIKTSDCMLFPSKKVTCYLKENNINKCK